MSSHIMLWIAAIFPLLSFFFGGAVYYWTKNGWLSTFVVAAITVASLILWFSMQFWPWLLLYLFLCWLGCWAGHVLRKSRAVSHASVDSIS